MKESILCRGCGPAWLVQYYGVDLGVEFKKYGAVILLDVLVTILTHEAFITDQKAIEFGFVLGREWIDAHLSESRG